MLIGLECLIPPSVENNGANHPTASTAHPVELVDL